MRNNNSLEKASKHNQRFFVVLFLVAVVALIIMMIGTLTDPRYNGSAENIFKITGLLIGGVGISAFSVYMMAYSRRCPSCNALWAKVADVSKTETLSKKKGYRTLSDTNDVKNSSGEVVGRTETSRQVRVLVSKQRLYYHCKVCGHVWTKDIEVEDDEFDDE